MQKSCTISCPECRRPVEVWITGSVTCQACGAPFKVGVYSPPPERFVGQTADGLSISGNWLQIRNHAYPLTDIVGTSLRRQGWGWRPYTIALLLIFAVAAAFARQWPVVGLLALGAVALFFQLRRQPEQYVVSWITRGGREDRQSLSSRQAALDLVDALRRGGVSAGPMVTPAAAPDGLEPVDGALLPEPERNFPRPA